MTERAAGTATKQESTSQHTNSKADISPSSQLPYSLAAMLQLQRTIGNRAVSKLFPGVQRTNAQYEPSKRSPQPSLRTAHTTLQREGLANEETKNAYVANTLSLRDTHVFGPLDPESGTRTPLGTTVEELIWDLYDQAMAQLVGQGVPPCYGLTFDGVEGQASFNRSTWSLRINPEAIQKNIALTDPADTLTDEAIAGLANSLYHESRHGEQYFRIAQKKAMQGDDAKEIEVLLHIPEGIAEIAAQNPLDPEADDAVITQAEEWDKFITGSFQKYASAVTVLTSNFDQLLNQTMLLKSDVPEFRQAVSTKILQLITDSEEYIEALESIIAVYSDPDAAALKPNAKIVTNSWEDYQVAVLSAIKGDMAAQDMAVKLVDVMREANDRAYRALPHEKDAFAQGDAVEARFSAALTP